MAALRRSLEYLETPPATERIEVQYRQNRATIFNSNLFHETQRTAFKPGYSNRRINLTLLFGERAACHMCMSHVVENVIQ